jgi:hypothetical protein
MKMLVRLAAKMVLGCRWEFSQNDIVRGKTSLTLSDLLCTGYITRKTPQGILVCPEKFTFVHSSLIEFLAAVNCKQNQGSRKQRRLIQKLSVQEHPSVFRFLCGLLRGSLLRNVVEFIITKTAVNEVTSLYCDQSHLLLKCLAEIDETVQNKVVETLSDYCSTRICVTSKCSPSCVEGLVKLLGFSKLCASRLSLSIDGAIETDISQVLTASADVGIVKKIEFFQYGNFKQLSQHLKLLQLERDDSHITEVSIHTPLIRECLGDSLPFGKSYRAWNCATATIFSCV